MDKNRLKTSAQWSLKLRSAPDPRPAATVKQVARKPTGFESHTARLMIGRSSIEHQALPCGVTDIASVIVYETHRACRGAQGCSAGAAVGALSALERTAKVISLSWHGLSRRASSPSDPRGRVTDWYDDPENRPSPSTADASWMRIYIVVALIGAEALGVIGGMLHILPA